MPRVTPLGTRLPSVGLFAAVFWSAISGLGCAGTVAAVAGSERVVVATVRPTATDPIARLRAVHGSGCGFAGALGNREGAIATLLNQSAEVRADSVFITSERAPYSDGECRHNEYIIEGLAFATRSAPQPQSSADIPWAPSARSGQKVSPEAVHIRYVLHVGGDAAGLTKHAKAPPPSPGGNSEGEAAKPDGENSAAVGGFRADLLRTSHFGGPLYAGYGFGAGGGIANGSRCTDAATCGTWKGWDVKYGPTAALGLKLHPGYPYVMLWLPSVRVEHLIWGIHSRNELCTSIYGSCKGASFANLAVSASVDFEWNIHEGRWDDKVLQGGGCGLGVGALALVGDLARREKAPLMVYVRLGFHYSFLE